MFIDYCLIGVYFIVVSILAIVMFTLSNMLGLKKPDNEKLSPYECGYHPFDDAQDKFNVHFYLVATFKSLIILFLFLNNNKYKNI
jgi:NADH-quinone oxidoreductase subunit A